MSNILVGGAVTGNVGSCKTEISQVVSGRSLLFEDIRNYATNSCTGQTEVFYSWRIAKETNEWICFSGISLVICLCLYGIYDQMRGGK